jgi:hypothetical protein
MSVSLFHHNRAWVVVRLMILLSGCSLIDVVNSQKSCIEYNINKGETLDADCALACAPSTYETFDWAEVSTDDPDTVIRTTVCRCLEAPNTFECFDYEDVWDLSDNGGGLDSCDEYNITSGTTCKTWCEENIDPEAYDVETKNGETTCSCIPDFKICSGNQVDDDILASGGVSAVPVGVVVATLSSSLMLAVVVGLFL